MLCVLEGMHARGDAPSAAVVAAAVQRIGAVGRRVPVARSGAAAVEVAMRHGPGLNTTAGACTSRVGVCICFSFWYY